MSIFGDELDLLKSLLGKDFVFGFTSEEKRGILIRPISFSKQMTASQASFCRQFEFYKDSVQIADDRYDILAIAINTKTQTGPFSSDRHF